MTTSNKYSITIVQVFGNITNSSAINIGFQLRRLPDDVKCVIFVISSSGGPLSAVQSLVRMVDRFKVERNAITVSYVMSDALSSAFYFALSSDYLFCESSSCLGNVGAKFKFLNSDSLNKKFGIDFMTVESGIFKSDLDRIGKKSEKKYLKNFVMYVLTVFLNDIKKFRPAINAEFLNEISDGRVISSEEALKNGMTDFIGGIPEVIELVVEKFGLNFEISLMNFTNESRIDAHDYRGIFNEVLY